MSDNTIVYIIYLVILLAVVSLGVLGGYRNRLREGLRHALLWVVIFAVLIIGVALWQGRGGLTDRLTAELDPAGGRQQADALIVAARDDGHFWLRAEVNGQDILFMIDTGATDIMLSPDDARKLGYDLESLKFTKIYETANGSVWGAPVRLESLEIGPIRLRDLPATVNGAEMQGSLLGQAFLKRLSGYSVRGRHMRLEP